MGKEFRRLKRYNATWRMIRALAAGMSVALLLLGCVLLADKLHMLDAGILHYAVGPVAGIAVATVYWLLQRRSDLRLAEKIDAEYQLKERVQTMVEYRDGETAMLQVQREDTERRLKEVRAFGQKKLTIAAHFALVAVALVVFAVGAVMPAQAVPQETVPTEPPYEVTEWQKAAVAELIKHVQKSDMAPEAKEPTLTQLQELLQALDTKLTVGNLKGKVINVMIQTYQVTDEVNSNDDIYDVILRNTDHAQAGMLAYAMGALNNADRGDQIETIRLALEKDEALATAGELADGLEEALKASAFGEEDPLYAAAATLAERLRQVQSCVEAEDPEGAKSALGIAFGELKVNVNNALEQQELTKEECVYVVDTLCTIFGITGTERPDDPDGEMVLQNGDNNYEASDGGYGTGDTNMSMAGTDQIYDYRNHQYELYSKLLQEYYYNEALQDMDNMSDELYQIVEKYFQEIMGSGTED